MSTNDASPGVPDDGDDAGDNDPQSTVRGPVDPVAVDHAVRNLIALQCKLLVAEGECVRSRDEASGAELQHVRGFFDFLAKHLAGYVQACTEFQVYIQGLGVVERPPEERGEPQIGDGPNSRIVKYPRPR